MIEDFINKKETEEKKLNNQNAFPISEKDYNRYYGGLPEWSGMTLRDYFANSAMQAIITGKLNDPNFVIGVNNESNNNNIASVSYSIADAMLKARTL